MQVEIDEVIRQRINLYAEQQVKHVLVNNLAGLRKGLHPNIMMETGRAAFLQLCGLPYTPAITDKTMKREETKIKGFYIRTLSKHSYDLTIDPRDLPNDRIALLTCEDGRTVKIHGWITAKEGRDIGTTRYFPSTNTTVYLVSKEQLHPFEETQNEAR